MKKIITFLFMFVVILCSNHKEQIIIPNESIRFRIIANSDNYLDQQVKLQIKKELIPVLGNILTNINNINDVRANIKSNLPSIEEIVRNNTSNYEVKFGNNFFPAKNYQNIHYQEGEYESLVITIGKGIGQNWWCVLFPPLCLLESDFNNLSETQYDYYLKKIINKYF